MTETRKILFFSLTFVFLFSCTSKIKKVNHNKEENKYTFSILRSTFQSQKQIKFLDTTEWILKSIWIIPQSKTVLNLNSIDSNFHTEINNNDFYQFSIKKATIYRNNLKIGYITQNIEDFSEVKDTNWNKVGKISFLRLNFKSKIDTIINGVFNIEYNKLNRLHLTQNRTDNKTKKKEKIRLVFYKRIRKTSP